MTSLFHEANAAYNNNNPELALKLMENAAREGDPSACYMIALWYSGADGMPLDKTRSKQWLARLEQLAEGGDLVAQWQLVSCYRFGDLLPQNNERANYWLERAADAGYGDAQHHLGWYYEHGLHGYPIDPAEAAKWYQRAFDQEHPETLYFYATKLFRDGRPTEEAISLLKKAAGKGFKQAEYLLQPYLH